MLYKDPTKFQNTLSFLTLSQNPLKNDASINRSTHFIPEVELINSIKTIQSFIRFSNSSDLKNFILSSAHFQMLVYQIDEVFDIHNIIIPLKKAKFPIITLLLLRKNLDIISQYSYFFLFLQCLLNDKGISYFFLKHNILEICFSDLQKRGPNDYYLISSLGFLISILERQDLINIVERIPFEDIFSNPNIENTFFIRSIFLLYQKIAKYGQMIPYPQKLLVLLNHISKFNNMDDITLHAILDFYLQISQLDIEIDVISNFFQKETIFDSLVQYALNSVEQYENILDLLNICNNVYKYLKNRVIKFHDKTAQQLLEYVTNICAEDSRDISTTLTLIYEMLKATDDFDSLLIIFKYLKFFIKINPICLNEEKIKNICMLLFEAVDDGNYDTKLLANKILSSVIKYGDFEINQYLLNNNIYDVFISGLLIDDYKVDSIVINNFYYFFEKFRFCSDFKAVVTKFADQTFFEVLNDVRERSEPEVALKCDHLVERIYHILANIEL